MWSENSTEIQDSYTKPLVLETYLTPHSTFHTPRNNSSVLTPQNTLVRHGIRSHLLHHGQQTVGAGG